MKILIEQKKLAEMLNMTARAASKANNVVPALSGVHLQAVNGSLILTSSNFEVSVKTSTTEVEIIEEGEALSNAQYLADFISKLNTSPISLELTKTSKLAIKYGKSKGNINTIGKDGWAAPKLDREGFNENFCVKSNDLKKALEAVMFAAANDHFRKVFTGVLFDIKDGVINFVASDTHKLAWYAISDAEGAKEGQFIAPTKLLKEVVRVLKDTEDLVTVMSNDSTLVFKTDETIISVRLLDGQFPDYRAIIPSATHSMSMATENLKSSLGRIKALPQDDKTKLPAAKLLINGNGEIKIEYVSEVAGTISEVIPLDDRPSLEEEMTIIVNANYLHEIASSINSQINIGFAEPARPILITGEDTVSKYVLVPMR